MSKKDKFSSISSLDKFLEYFFHFFIITFPFISYRIFIYGGTSTRFVHLVLFVTICGLLLSFYLFKKNTPLSLTRSPIAISLSIYFLSILISAIFGLNFETSFWSIITRTSGIWYFFNLGIFIYLLYRILNDRQRQNRLILSLILSTALYSLLAFTSLEGTGVLFRGYISDAFTFGNSSFAGMYIFGAFILSLYYLFQSESKKWWMYIIPLIILISPNTINGKIWSGDFSMGLIGEARASSYVVLLSLVFIFIFWCINKIKDSVIKSRVLYSIFGVSIIIMIFSSFSLLSHNGYLRNLYLKQASGARPLVWEISEKVINQRPFFGWGTDNFERVFEINYDNRLLQDEYGNEAWFDRAHNIFIDQIIDNGFVGLIFYILVYIISIFILIRIFINTNNRDDRILSSILITYLVLHFIELQTAFDTTISYPMVAFMFALSISLDNRMRLENGMKYEIIINTNIKYIVSAILALILLVLFFVGWIPFVRAQISNGIIRTIGSSKERVQEYSILFASPVDQHSFLWRMSTDLEKAIGENPKVLEDKVKYNDLGKEFAVLEGYYVEYIKNNPNHFRAKLNLADVLIYQRLFGVDKLKEAQSILDEAIKQVPQAPQPYWMKAVAYIYMRKFDLAQEYAKKGLDLNPKAKQSQRVYDYVTKSSKDFPNIDLFFFKQI